MTARWMKLLHRTHRCHLHRVPLLSLRRNMMIMRKKGATAATGRPRSHHPGRDGHGDHFAALTHRFAWQARIIVSEDQHGFLGLHVTSKTSSADVCLLKTGPQCAVAGAHAQVERPFQTRLCQRKLSAIARSLISELLSTAKSVT